MPPEKIALLCKKVSLNIVSHACAFAQEGIIYGMMTASEKKLLNGRSVRTISHARPDPSKIAKNDTKNPIIRELSKG